jgi:predicted GNAT family acetyltransferase
MSESDSSITVVDNPDRSRYEAFVGDQLAGFVTYRTRTGVVILVHTEVDEAFEGHGVGGRLAAAALADVGARGLKVEAWCPFIARYLEQHPELSDPVTRPDRS